MSKQIQIRRDGATAINAAILALSELGHNTTNQRLHVGDGTTPGGMPLPNMVDIQNNAFTGVTAAGTANTITGTLAKFVFGNFAQLKLKITITNTGPATLNMNTTTPINIYKNVGGTIGAIAAGDLLAGYIYDLIGDGTNYLLMGGSPSNGGFTTVRTVYTANATWTKDAKLIGAFVEVMSAGGGSAQSGAQTIINPGPGIYNCAYYDASSLSSSEAVTIGAAGVGKTGGVGAGGAGGTSSFGSHISCTGGGGGQTNTGTNVSEGTATGGDLARSGKNYGNAVAVAISATASDGRFDGIDTSWGRGGRRGIGSLAPAAATGYGASGGSPRSVDAGVNGAPGLIIVTEYRTL